MRVIEIRRQKSDIVALECGSHAPAFSGRGEALRVTLEV